MTLRNLNDGEMIEVSGAWIDARRGRHAFEAIPLLAALLPSVIEAHSGLVAAGAPKADDGREAERQKLYVEGTALDQRHDRKGRGVFNLLGALADLTDDPEEAARFAALQRAIFPDGTLSVLKASWRGEAGNALAVKERVLDDRDLSAALKAIPLPGRATLLDRTREFVDAGRKLGGIEDRRAVLNAPTTEATPTKSGTVSARNRWCSVVGTAVRLADDVLGLDATTRHALFGALDEVERKADARELGRRPVATDGDGGAEAPKGAPTDGGTGRTVK